MTSALAGAARSCLLAAIHAADPRALTARALRRSPPATGPGREVQLVAVGKAAEQMVAGAYDVLGGLVTRGVVVAPGVLAPDVLARPPRHVLAFVGGHPMPSAEGMRGAQAIAELLHHAAPGDTVLCLLSGGASALATLPAGDLTLDDVAETTRALMAAGADINELNCVRKHLDRLKGGQLAAAGGGAAIRALVLSDVIGDRLDVIASGPLVPDPTTFGDAVAVLRGRGLWSTLPSRVADHLLCGTRGERAETAKAGHPCFANVDVEIIGNNALAVQGACDEGRRRGFDVERLAAPLTGEAREAGAWLARYALERRSASPGGRPLCIAGGGETTVTVTGDGAGGRNQELAAAAALAMEGARGVAIGSIGTDGRDGPTDAAGAVVDGETAARSRARGLDLARHLPCNDTLPALDAAGALVRTGPTGTNVMDVQVALLER